MNSASILNQSKSENRLNNHFGSLNGTLVVAGFEWGKEDMEICEQVQIGLQSCAYDKGRFSVEMEQGVYHFQKLLKKLFRGDFSSGGMDYQV